MTVLITGGCGFVGSELAAELLRRGEDVYVFDNLSRAGAAANLDWLRSLGPVRFVLGDVRDPAGLCAAVATAAPAALLHLAGQVAMTTSLLDPRLDFETNANGSFNVLEAVRAHAPGASLIYASTNKVYGNLAQLRLQEGATRYRPATGKSGIDETFALDFRSPYGCSKGTADQYMLDYARNYGTNAVVFRHSTIYGERQFATVDQGWVGWFCAEALAKQADPQRAPFTICGNGKQVRDLLHVSDAVACYLAALQHIASARGRAFNIGGGAANSLSLLELFAFLEQHLNIELRYRSVEERQSDQRYFVADPGEASRILNWTPAISYQRGITRVLDGARSRERSLAR